jgi:hypothetical protein
LFDNHAHNICHKILDLYPPEVFALIVPFLIGLYRSFPIFIESSRLSFALQPPS